MLSRWLVRAVEGLAHAGPRIDAVNVFPVADQDTGTNCLLTLRGALDEVGALDPQADGPTVLAAAARGALLSARGNSGMILSHWWAGLARGAEHGMAAALTGAATSARSAVMQPEAGTVLDLADEFARAAQQAWDPATDDPDRVALDAALAAGRDALDAISARHPVLRDARVLDAGACALLVVLGAWTLDDAPSDLSWLPESAPTALPAAGLSGFEVMAVLPAGDDDVLRAALAAVGDSVAVVTEPAGPGQTGSRIGRVRQTHVHTPDPAAALRVLRSAAGGTPLAATVHALDAAECAAVAVTGSPERAQELTRAGAVVVVVSDDPSASAWGHALGRAVHDARRGGPHAPVAAATVDRDPLPVLPGAWARDCAAVLPPDTVLVAEADDDDRVLAVLRALTGQVQG